MIEPSVLSFLRLLDQTELSYPHLPKSNLLLETKEEFKNHSFYLFSIPSSSLEALDKHILDSPL